MANVDRAIVASLIVLAASLPITACESREAANTDRPNLKGHAGVIALPLPGGNKVLEDLYDTHLKAETTLVVRDSASWADLWPRLGTGPAPAVDFANEMLLVAGSGSRQWGTDVTIRVAANEPYGLAVTVHERVNIPNLCALDGFRSPADVVRVRRDKRPVMFRWEVEEMHCS
jgi:hypothetical protein